jgi:hypothetical protein
MLAAFLSSTPSGFWPTACSDILLGLTSPTPDRGANWEESMQIYAIRRRNAWKSPEELKATAERSGRIGEEEMSDQVRWIRSYVVHEDDGTLGTICIYQAKSPEAIREHARRVGMPGEEISPIVDTVVIRPDPTKEAQTA